MTPSVLLLTLAYVAVAALLLHLGLRSSVAGPVKLAAIGAVTGLYAAAWHGWFGLLGWPSPSTLPPSFRLHAVQIDEPVRGSDDPGGIYLWLRPLDGDDRPSGPPRAFALPWDPEFAEQAGSAQTALEGGARLDGYFTGSTNESSGAKGETRGSGSRDSDGPLLEDPLEERSRLEFKPVGRPELPPKDPPAIPEPNR